jgi:hypothetical protein
MHDGEATPADEAGAWLREHFKDDPAPRVDITLVPGQANSAVYQEVMEILFGPPGG